MIPVLKSRNDAPQTSNEKNKCPEKRMKTVSIFKSLKNVILCHDSKDLQLCGNQFSLSKVSRTHTHTLTNHITHKTQSFMGCREKKMQRKKGENISSPSPTLCHSFLRAGQCVPLFPPPVCATLSSAGQWVPPFPPRASVCHQESANWLYWSHFRDCLNLVYRDCATCNYFNLHK